jgi:hypothetical protein
VESEKLCEKADIDLVVLNIISSFGLVSNERAEHEHSDLSASSHLSASSLIASILHGRKCVIQLFERSHKTGRCSCTEIPSGVSSSGRADETMSRVQQASLLVNI